MHHSIEVRLQRAVEPKSYPARSPHSCPHQCKLWHVHGAASIPPCGDRGSQSGSRWNRPRQENPELKRIDSRTARPERFGKSDAPGRHGQGRRPEARLHRLRLDHVCDTDAGTRQDDAVGAGLYGRLPRGHHHFRIQAKTNPVACGSHDERAGPKQRRVGDHALRPPREPICGDRYRPDLDNRPPGPPSPPNRPEFNTPTMITERSGLLLHQAAQPIHRPEPNCAMPCQTQYAQYQNNPGPRRWGS